VPALLYDKGLIPLSQGLRGILALSKIGYFSEKVIHTSLKELLKSKRLGGVLFDLDGVLVDTMRLHDRAWREAIFPLGLKISDEEIYLREGEKGTVTAHDFLLKANKESTPESIGLLLKEKERHFKQNSKIELFPKALTCLEFFYKKGYLLGLVTGTSLGEVKVFLEEGFLKLFKTIVTGDRVTFGKPHPEPYLSAIDKIGLKPEEALVIENAPYGIRSAKSAQLACIALATSLPRSYLSEADLILSGLEELLQLFVDSGSSPG
jgi:beta-phosphoglucomutase-like phosphatase (HAD superfamily)